MPCLLELEGFPVFAEYFDFKRSPPLYGAEQVWVVQAVGTSCSCRWSSGRGCPAPHALAGNGTDAGDIGSFALIVENHELGLSMIFA
jgi:hypothetical protein